MNNDLISRSALKDFINEVCFSKKWVKYRVDNGSIGQIECILTYIDNAPTVEDRMFYVQETVNTILNSCTGNTDVDKAFRNAARLVQNAIDGKSVDFEEIERRSEE